MAEPKPTPDAAAHDVISAQEKGPSNTIQQEIDQGNEAVLLDISAAGKSRGHLKLAKDGHTVLIPQPSDDPDDPLNWSWGKKHMILFILALSAFLGDFGSGAGIPCIIPQGEEWGMSPGKVNYAGNLNVLMLGLGGVLWIPPIYFWGRAPVLFWTTLMGTFFTLACVITPSFSVFYAFRALMGLTHTAAQTIGLAFIKDMFFFHEHARKIGLWVAFFFASPYCGPLFGNSIIDGTGEWRPVFWLVFAIGCTDLLLIVLFTDETWYRRGIPQAQQPDRGGRMPRIWGVWQWRHHDYFMPVGRSCQRLIAVFLKPVIVPTMVYYAMSFMWAVGINITSSILFATLEEAGGYGFGPRAVGFLYITPVVGITLGELFGHFFNDWNANRYIRKHGGVFRHEARLWTNYIGSFFMLPGLIIVGQALHRQLSVGAVIMGWGMYAFGVMVASVGITAYILDCYPTGSGEVSSFMNFTRTISGFTVGYFQAPWGTATGYDVSFGIQAAIIALATGLLICIQIFGERWQEKGGPLKL